MDVHTAPQVAGVGDRHRPIDLARFGARTLALWFGLFTLVNVAGALRNPTFDENLWWVDLRFLPGSSEQVILVLAGLLLVAHAIRPAFRGWRRIATEVAFAALVLAAVTNTVSYYRAWVAGTIRPMMWVPLSLLIAALLAGVAWLSLGSGATRPTLGWRVLVAAVMSGLFLIAVPISQILFFGTTDYRRPADAIVVLGAEVHADGTPSLSLSDRMSTAVELYRQGLAPTLIVSGGVEPNGQSETEVMSRMAQSHGVPSSAIVQDPHGVNTDATVEDTVAIFRERGVDSALVVSHFYHLPRIKLAYQGAGYDVYTVPSKSTAIPQLPFLVAREVPAFWVYYLRAAV